MALLVAAFVVQGCGAPATPQATEAAASVAPTAAPATDTPAPTATKVPEKVARGELPVGFTEEGVPYRGDPSAPVTLEEYSDFQ